MIPEISGLRVTQPKTCVKLWVPMKLGLDADFYSKLQEDLNCTGYTAVKGYGCWTGENGHESEELEIVTFFTPMGRKAAWVYMTGVASGLIDRFDEEAVLFTVGLQSYIIRRGSDEAVR